MTATMTNPSPAFPMLRRFDPAVLTAFGCIILLLLFGSRFESELPVAGISAAAAPGRRPSWR